MEELIRFFGDIHTISECMKVFASMSKKMAVIEKDAPLRASCAQEPVLFDAVKEPEREKPHVSGKKGRPRRTDLVRATYMFKDYGFTQKQTSYMAKMLGIRCVKLKGDHIAYFPADAERIVAELKKMQRKSS